MSGEIVGVEDPIVTIEARNTWVIARRDHVDEKTAGGVFLPHSVRQTQEKETGAGIVDSVGDGSNPHNGGQGTPPCAVGDRILWSTYAERVVLSEDTGDIVAIPFKEVIGVLR